MLVLGPVLSDFIRRLDAPGVRLLPVKIHDHKGRVASSEVNILHTDLAVDCIDPEASMIEWSPLDEELALNWESLELAELSEPLPPLFQIRHIVSSIFVRGDVAKDLEALGLPEVYLTPLEEVEPS
jgi:hypothetical protein